jgi:uncharacterized protein with PIN domain
MRFIADSMLGRLARWLRLLGFDTLYEPRIEDSRLLRIAREEQRTLLTRDTRLVKVRGLKDFLLIHENDPFAQLRTVITEFSLYKPGKGGFETRPYSRCSHCNTLLEVIPKEQAKDSVPLFVFQTSDNFRKCPHCDKYYWQGSHADRLREKLQEILYN